MSCQDQKNTLESKIVTDTYYGQEIQDPYRYMEDLETPQVVDWIDNQNLTTTNFLSSIGKKQHLINKQQDFAKKKSFQISKLKITSNNQYFYLKRSAKDNVPKLYYRKSFGDKEVLLFDSKDFKPESNTEYIINYIQPNWDGSAIAISHTTKGKEISEIIVLNVTTKKTYPQIIENAWPSKFEGIKWLPDNASFIYLRYNTKDKASKGFLKNTKSLLYKVGEAPEKAIEIFSKNNNPALNLTADDYPEISFKNKENKYLLGKTPGISAYHNSYYLPIHKIGSKEWKPLFTKADHIKNYIIRGDSLIYITSKNAPNFKICTTSILNPDFNNSKVLVAEKKDLVITDFDITSEGLYFVTSKNGVKASLFHSKNTVEKEIKLPKVYGSIGIKSKGIQYPELWITASGWTTKNKRFEYSNGQLVDKDLNLVQSGDQFNDVIVEEIEVTGHDGQKIPLSLFYNKKIDKNSKNRVLMDGYGAYGISMKPSFKLRRLLWVQEGGIYAIAHVRGGGEKGDTWHKQGYKETKPNTWKDFISCAEYLITNNITTPKQLAVWSGSAGGILIGRAITERPELFAAAIVEFGMLNTLRSENRPNGVKNNKEYGTIKDPEEFKGLLEMDAYHHLKDGTEYPATLLTAGINDARVPAWFSAKFAARMQAANAADTENLLLIDKESGHGVDETKMRGFERFATIISFALWQTGHPGYQPNIKN